MEKPGAALQGGAEEARRDAARIMGQSRSERKASAVRENGKLGGAHPFTEETRAKLREAQAIRRERERQEKAALGVQEAPRRPRGRPKKTTQSEQTTEEGSE